MVVAYKIIVLLTSLFKWSCFQLRYTHPGKGKSESISTSLDKQNVSRHKLKTKV